MDKQQKALEAAMVIMALAGILFITAALVRLTIWVATVQPESRKVEGR